MEVTFNIMNEKFNFLELQLFIKENKLGKINFSLGKVEF